MVMPLEPVPGYEVVTNGWSASLNSTIFYACDRCGACIAENVNRMSDYNRAFHTHWHQEQDGL
jgi:hypothetical protein